MDTLVRTRSLVLALILAACGSSASGTAGPGADAASDGSTALDAASDAPSASGDAASGSSGGSPSDAGPDTGPSPGDAASGYEGGTPVGACPTPTGTPVTLMQNGTSSVLSNGLVTVTIAAGGQVTQVAASGKNLMSSGETMYVSESGGSTYYAINATSHTVVQQAADIVELSFVDTSGGNHDMDWDLHYVVRQGVSGFYYFLVTAVGTATHPNPATLSELRTVQRFDETVLPNGYSGERHGVLPTEAQISAAMTVQNATYLLTTNPTVLHTVSSLPGVLGQDYDEGPVFTKYDWSSYRSEDALHGLYGSGFGVWLLSPSWEFYTGAALKQELMVQDGTLLLNMYHGGHAGSATTTPSPANWQKIYGPNLVYVNSGTDAQVIADAQARAATEQTAWPYCWMKNNLYPLIAARGTVTGTLVEAHGRSVAGAMVTLAQTGALLSQGYDYMFWSQADASGHFTIPAVRPGHYSVHVYPTQGTIVNDPATGEIAGTVDVVAGTNDMGTVMWSPPYHANLIWAIGDSDRTSGEFRFDPKAAAGPSNTAYETGRMYGPSGTAGVWTIPPANLTYTVGTSTPQSDWYFAQSADGTWTVDFDLASVPAGGATLTVALAGAAQDPHLNAFANGHQVVNMGLGNDQTLYRSCLEGGLYQVLTASVPAADLMAGANTVTLTMNTKGTAGAGVYYDIVKLESD
jgi:rhamnogalacturonan endolyase